MATKNMKPLRGRRVRFTRLDTAGAHVVGSCSSVVTDGFISVKVTPVYKEGDEYLQENAWGDLCVSEKGPPRVKWAALQIVMCDIDPNVIDFIIDASQIVTSGADSIGNSFGQTGTEAAFAVEAWSGLAGKPTTGGNLDWGYFAVPLIRNGMIDGDAVMIQKGVMNLSMKAEAYPAPATWATTPYTDNPLLRTGGFIAGDIWADVRTTVQPPTLTNGCAALA